ncbi:IS3 family transposase [Bacillus methanolicus]|uniref:IS3 family transposase n=1 Tax=Bacillus methanolicus TaxID=1471 RepID=UPI003B75C82A
MDAGSASCVFRIPPTVWDPKVTKKLNHEGIKVSQKTVSRIMKEEGMKSRTVKKHKAATTNLKHNHFRSTKMS